MVNEVNQKRCGTCWHGLNAGEKSFVYCRVLKCKVYANSLPCSCWRENSTESK